MYIFIHYCLKVYNEFDRIRTGNVSYVPDFESGAFNHSATNSMGAAGFEPALLAYALGLKPSPFDLAWVHTHMRPSGFEPENSCEIQDSKSCVFNRA